MIERDKEEVQELQTRMPQWLGLYLSRACRFALEGPRWLPRWLRRVPLDAGCVAVKAYGGRWL